MINDFINQFHNNYSFMIAYSGGIDSTVLLHQFIHLKKKIIL
ncbi:hypothetical protein [Buchnera aphidicola]